MVTNEGLGDGWLQAHKGMRTSAQHVVHMASGEAAGDWGEITVIVHSVGYQNARGVIRRNLPLVVKQNKQIGGHRWWRSY